MLCENKRFIILSVIGKVVLFHCSNMLHMHLIAAMVTFLHGRRFLLQNFLAYGT